MSLTTYRSQVELFWGDRERPRDHKDRASVLHELGFILDERSVYTTQSIRSILLIGGEVRRSVRAINVDELHWRRLALHLVGGTAPEQFPESAGRSPVKNGSIGYERATPPPGSSAWQVRVWVDFGGTKSRPVAYDRWFGSFAEAQADAQDIADAETYTAYGKTHHVLAVEAYEMAVHKYARFSRPSRLVPHLFQTGGVRNPLQSGGMSLD